MHYAEPQGSVDCVHCELVELAMGWLEHRGSLARGFGACCEFLEELLDARQSCQATGAEVLFREIFLDSE